MRPRLRTLATVAHALGLVLLVLAGALLVTGVVAALLGEALGPLALAFGLPALITAGAGAGMWARIPSRPLDEVQAMLVCTAAWLLASAIGAAPLMVLLDASFVDASFEMVSGFTTTGITVFSGLDTMPASVLLWRALSQWIGGVGILSLFVALTQSSALAHRLGGTEAHKIRSSRSVPGPLRTLQLFVYLYVGFTVLVALGLLAAGMSWFDAITHAFTTLSTGGFSTHDASIAYYREPGVDVNVRAVEWILIAGMAAGGTSFVVHYRLVCREWRALWDGSEVRLWIGLIVGVVALLVFEQWHEGVGMFADDALVTTHAANAGGLARAEAGLRTSLFTTLAIVTTTGYATVDIASPFFAHTAKTLFLILMLFGGCVGSTTGGFKLTRVILLVKVMVRELRRLVLPSAAQTPVVLDRRVVGVPELGRVTALAVAWMCMLAFGTVLTTMLSDHDGWQALSGISSALNNIGPCYISIPEIQQLPWAVKLTWMVAMLAGRLEVLPLFVFMSVRAWTR